MDPTVRITNTPVAVATNLQFDDLDVAGHICATAKRVLYCWGQNAEGQVGDRTQLYRAEPVMIRLQ